MTLTFRHAAELEAGGTAAYLRLTPGREERSRAGGLLQLNSRGEPVEFTYSEVTEPDSALWQPERLAEHLQVEICIALFRRAHRSPLLPLYREGELPATLFETELLLEVPVGRVTPVSDCGPTIAARAPAAGADHEHLDVIWHPAPPAAGSAAGNLLAALRQRQLLREPFDRIPVGLRQIWRSEQPSCLL